MKQETEIKAPPEYMDIVWKLIVEAREPQKAVNYADNTVEYYNHVIDKTQDGSNEDIPEVMQLKSAAYSTCAIAYAWAGEYQKAFDLEKWFLPPFNYALKEMIEHYILMLVFREQKEHLDQLFEDPQIREEFFPYYESYISILVDPHYEWKSKQSLLVPILNKMMQGRKIYGPASSN